MAWGRLSCIDASTGKVIWKYLDVGRTISTASVHEGLVYIAEYAGIIHCLDAETGKLYWTHDSFSRIWGSTLVADGKVLLGNEDGDLLIIDHEKDKPKVETVNMGAPVWQFSSRCQQYLLCCHADSPLRHWEITILIIMGKIIVWSLFVILFFLHQDFWWWKILIWYWVLCSSVLLTTQHFRLPVPVLAAWRYDTLGRMI